MFPLRIIYLFGARGQGCSLPLVFFSHPRGGTPIPNRVLDVGTACHTFLTILKPPKSSLIARSDCRIFRMRILKAYDTALAKMPLLTKTSSAFVIFGCCEFNAQLLTNETHEGASLRERFLNVQWPQVFGFACFSFYNAPLMHTYYRVTLAQKWPLVPRIAANCLVVDPANFSVAILISSANKAISKGHDISTACSLAGTKPTRFPGCGCKPT